MDIILLQDVDKVGDKFTVVTVKNGYGRNYLIPKGLALVANSSNRRQLAELVRQEDVRESKRLDEYKSVAAQVTGVTLSIPAKTGASGKIFGSVTNVTLAHALQEKGITIERKKITINGEVKELGSYTAIVQLHKEVAAELKFDVVAAAE